MKFDFLKNKVFIISFIVLILFSFFISSGVYAADRFNPDYDYLYKFVINEDENFSFETSTNAGLPNFNYKDYQSLISKIKKEDSFVSGNYYYFLIAGDGGFTYYKVLKSSFDSSNDLFISYNTNNHNYLSCYERPAYSFSYINSKNENILHFTNLNFYPDFDNRILTTYFWTNYDKPIQIKYKNTDKGFGSFFGVAPTFKLTKEVGQIPEIMTKIIKQILPIGLIVLGIGLLIYLIRRVIYSMK